MKKNQCWGARQDEDGLRVNLEYKQRAGLCGSLIYVGASDTQAPFNRLTDFGLNYHAHFGLNYYAHLELECGVQV